MPARPRGKGLPARATAHRWTCRGCGKQAYSSRAQARRGAAEQERPGLRVYECDQAPGAWHLTSRPAATVARYREADRG